MKKLVATGNRVIIRQKESSNTTSSGIVLQSAQETPQALVVAVGDRVQGIKVGDTILVDWARVGAFEYERVHYNIVIDENILAVVEH